MLAAVGMTAVLAIAAPGRRPQPSKTHATPTAASDEIIVRMEPGASVFRLRRELAMRGLTFHGRIPHSNVVSVATNGRTPAAAIRSLDDAATVVDASPNYVRRALEVPDDPYVGSAKPYFDAIRLTQAWDLSHGAGDVVIAVVDTGVSPVADLADRLLPGHNFVQDDDATFDSEPAPDPGDTRDTSAVGHGTLVAGIAAAMTNNGVGIAGVAWDAHVLPVKVLNYYGNGDDFLIGKGIVWAADHGADIINLSLGGASESGGLCDAVEYATSKGALVVAAAGNGEDRAAMYPAACPGAVAVTATDANGDFTYFSNYGRWVDLAAPGVQITSTRNDGGYLAEDGTSFAAPIVSGVAALVLAQHPDWSPGQIEARLAETAQDRGPAGHDSFYGHGLLDAYAALGGPRQAPATPAHDALEPNDVAADATPLHTPTRGTIAPEGDVDWYTVRVPRPGSLVFQVGGCAFNSNATRNFDPVLAVYDGHLRLLTTKNASRYGAGERVSARVRVAGRYFLRVANHAGAESPGSYSVAVTMQRSR